MIVKEVILTVPNQLCGFLEIRLLYQYIVALIKHGIVLIRELNLKKIRASAFGFSLDASQSSTMIVSTEERKSKTCFLLLFNYCYFQLYLNVIVILCPLY